ncbi:MAG: hypothetical protein ABIV43_01440 [Candidatus Saccharimonadales bacterium]
MSDVDSQKALDVADIAKTASEQDADDAAVEYSQGVNSDEKGNPTMGVKIHSPFHDYYNGPAFSVSAINATGPFDILPRHHNFISLLQPCELVVRTVDKGDQRIKISGGIMHVKADELIVFLDV